MIFFQSKNTFQMVMNFIVDFVPENNQSKVY